jgi:hypothetical protein
LKEFAQSQKPNTSVSQVRMVRTSARKMDVPLIDLLSTLLHDSLTWTSFLAPLPIPPMPNAQEFPTCAFDTCILELQALDAVCIQSPAVWPQTISKERWLQNQSFASDGAAAGYFDFLRTELMTAMCVARAACVGGLCWPGSTVDTSGGLPLCDVSEFVLGVGMPAGHHFSAAYFDDELPTALARSMTAISAKPAFKVTKTEEEFKADAATALQSVIAKKTLKQESETGVRSGRLAGVLERKASFIARTDVAIALACSGQQDMSQEQWQHQLSVRHPDADVKEMMAKQTEYGVTESNKILLVSDMSYVHPGMKTLCCFGGTKLQSNNLKHKALFEKDPVQERPYHIVPLLKNLGRAIHAVVYEYFGPGTRGQEGFLDTTSDVVVVLPFLQLVPITKPMENLTWEEVLQQFPEVEESRIFILHMFQMRSDGGMEFVDMDVDCKTGVFQVLCAEYVTLEDGQGVEVEYFTERLDEIMNTCYIDPCNLGPIRVGSPLDKELKLRGTLKAIIDAAKDAKFVGDFIQGGRVLLDNLKTSANGMLRRESSAPLSGIEGSLSAGYSVYKDAVNKSIVSDVDTVPARPAAAVTRKRGKPDTKKSTTPAAKGVKETLTPVYKGGASANGADEMLLCR